MVSMRLGVTPVPISNTMVKTRAAENTRLETVWEDRWAPALKRNYPNEIPDFIREGDDAERVDDRAVCARSEKKRSGHRRRGGVAQLGEHLPCKQGVKSSNLSISTR